MKDHISHHVGMENLWPIGNYLGLMQSLVESLYYLRIMTKDIAGVLSMITSYFRDFDISIEKILQIPDNKTNTSIPIIIFTHPTIRRKLLDAISLIEKQDFVLEKISIVAIDKSLK